jgi:hypothetical protein
MLSQEESSHTPLNLLINTFNPDARENHSYPSGARVLARTYQAVNAGELRVNGQPPDTNYPLGEYLIHGNRIKFDLRQLTKEEQQKFYDYLVEGAEVIPRKFATHRFSDQLDASGVPIEIVPHGYEKVTGALRDIVNVLIRNEKHFGVNLPVGGVGTEIHGHTVEENGEHGHLYIHRDLKRGMMMIGVEGSEPGKHNKRTGAGHSVAGAPSDYSAFMALKANDIRLIEMQRMSGLCPLSTTERGNWTCVSEISKKTLTALIKGSSLRLERSETRNEFLNILNSPHHSSIVVTNIVEREKAMIDWQRETNRRSFSETSELQTDIDFAEQKNVLKWFEENLLPQALQSGYSGRVRDDGMIEIKFLVEIMCNYISVLRNDFDKLRLEARELGVEDAYNFDQIAEKLEYAMTNQIDIGWLVSFEKTIEFVRDDLKKYKIVDGIMEKSVSLQYTASEEFRSDIQVENSDTELKDNMDVFVYHRPS